MNVTVEDEIQTYVEAVRRALAGLGEAICRELLEDLPEHLAEVRAEGIGTLVERLGTPEAYASELLASAGLVGGFPDPPPAGFGRAALARAATTADRARRRLGGMDVKLGPVIGYDKVSDFVVLLRPAWWVLRGYLAAMAIAWLFAGSRTGFGLLPRVGGNVVVGVLLVTGGVVLSILLGRRRPTLSRVPRFALRAATVFLSFFALAGVITIDSDSQYPGFTNVVDYDSNPYSNVEDVFVYDRQGRLVEGARLFDQDGSPIQLGTSWCTDPDTGESTRSRNMGYPYCPADPPFSPSGEQGVTAPASSLPAPAGSLPAPAGSLPAPAGSATPSRGSAPSGRTPTSAPTR